MNSIHKSVYLDSISSGSPLLRDLAEHYGSDDIAEWIEEEGQRLSILGRTKTGSIDVLKRELCIERNIVRVVRDNHMSADACIVSQENYYVVYYRQGVRENLRFAMAHEIGHTYWFKPGSRCDPLSSFQRRVGEDPEIEWLCNRFASSLLMPRTDLFAEIGRDARKLITRMPLLRLIPRMAEHFVVSEQVAARRLMYELFNRNEAVICVRLTDPSRQSSRYLDVDWCVTPQPIGHKTLKNGQNIPAMTPGFKLRSSTLLWEDIAESTQLVDLDMNWVRICQPLLKEVTVDDLAWGESAERIKGFATRIGDRFLIAVPLS